MIPQRLQAQLDSGRPLLLDGGLGGELDRRGHDLSSPLWSAQLLRHEPQAIAAVHRAFLDAGAMCITTSSYQASVPGLQAEGLEFEQMRDLFERSVALAREVCDEFMRQNPQCDFEPLVAASVGPYGAYLADGSEYRGNYGLSDDELRAFHAPRLQWLDVAGADLIACETMPDLKELEVLKQLLDQTRTPAWVSFCCRDESSLHDGSRLEAAAEIFAGGSQPFALGVNCCPPSLVSGSIARIRTVVPHKPIVVYPNSGQQYDASAKSWHGERALDQWSRLAEEWFEAGAGMIGGCCHIGPEYIRELSSKTTWPC